MYKLSICDDDEYSLATIKEKIEALPCNFDISCYTSPTQLLQDFEKNPSNVVCLDIQIPELSGFELATKLKVIYRDVLIIFITHHDGFTAKSINYRPIGFIRKNDFSNLAETFKFVMSELELLHTIYSLSHDNIAFNLKETDIIYFEKKGNDLYIQAKQAKYKIRKSLKQIEAIVNPKLFIKVNRSTIINIRKIRTLDKTNLTIFLNTGDTIKYSRVYKDALYGAYRKVILRQT